MKLGVNSYIVREISGKGFSLDDLRVDFIELGFDDAGLVENGEIQQGTFKDLEGLGVEFTLHAPTADGKNLPLDLGVYGKEPVKRMEKVIRIANHLGAEVIVVHGGDIGKSYTKAYVNTLKHLRELKSIAEDSGVKLVVENLFEGRIGALPHELLSFVSEGFELCFDIGHAFLTSMHSGLKMDEFNVLFPYTSHLHIHDNNGSKDEHRPLGGGMVGFFYAGQAIKLTNAKRAVLEIRGYSGRDSVLSNVSFLRRTLDEKFSWKEKAEEGSEA
ncbi:sugar phosphate isomerase/epimerase family protein [Palaeococcus ferrophilus]|uniref:sugar phosphate isomerase/epimerase family protein n=1 Tax=Palaeococcus ferrophilus TaxID=83868 RepID=UPI00064FCFB6|nr:sugar phosphate isomerase/epimerase family protein [Palaeococcus ferrophilus]